MDLDHAIPPTSVPADPDPTSLDDSPPPVPRSTVARLAELVISCIGNREFIAGREILMALIRIEGAGVEAEEADEDPTAVVDPVDVGEETR
jgi:hypothetical protein